MNLIKTFHDFLIEKNITENLQMADKLFFDTGKLSKDNRKDVLGITNGDQYTKLISEIYYEFRIMYSGYFNLEQILKRTKVLYEEIKSYNKNVFPIKGFDVYHPTVVISEIIFALESRKSIIKQLKSLPSIAIRNMKDDIRKERTSNQLERYNSDLEYFIFNLKYLDNRDEKIKNIFLQKMFKNNITLNDLMRFVDEKSNFIGGVEFTKKEIENICETENCEIIYDKENIMIVKVKSGQAIKKIGCNSLWCFTYGSEFDKASKDWNVYSYDGIVYVIIDFKEKIDSADFMHVMIKPLIDEKTGKFLKYTEENEDEIPIFNMQNENSYNPYDILKRLFGSGYKKIIKEYLNFDYQY